MIFSPYLTSFRTKRYGAQLEFKGSHVRASWTEEIALVHHQDIKHNLQDTEFEDFWR